MERHYAGSLWRIIESKVPIAKVNKWALNLLLTERKCEARFSQEWFLQFLVHRENEHQIPALRLGQRNGVDELQSNHPRFMIWETVLKLDPSDLGIFTIRSGRKKIGPQKWKIKKKIENKCWRMWKEQGYLGWESGPCCFWQGCQVVNGRIGKQILGDSHLRYCCQYLDFPKDALLELGTQIEKL